MYCKRKDLLGNKLFGICLFVCLFSNEVVDFLVSWFCNAYLRIAENCKTLEQSKSLFNLPKVTCLVRTFVSLAPMKL